MEEEWYVARACLLHLRKKHPKWSKRYLAKEIGYSYNWVCKWCQRFDKAEADAPSVLCSHSRCRKRLPERIHPEVVRKILSIRDEPPKPKFRTLINE